MSEQFSSVKVNLLDLRFEDLCQFFIDLGEKRFRANQTYKWIHQYGKDNFAEMTDLSKALREYLPNVCEIRAPEIAEEMQSTDGTVKWLLRLPDGNHIETVYIPENDRGTLCVSSQVGCALDCSFCSTGKQGFSRNLEVSEIIGQVWLAQRRLKIIKSNHKVGQESEDRDENVDENSDKNIGLESNLSNDTDNDSENARSITNVVMMGMGEPLLNFEAVMRSMAIMRDDNAYALPRRRVTLSTAGVVPKIDGLREQADVSLAISLHAPNDELRNILVPLNKKYPIHELIAACKRYVGSDNRRHVTIEYVMLQNINDTAVHARQLAKILEGLSCKVNLIPFNPHPGTEYQRSTTDTINQFRAILVRAGLVTTVRKTRGDDIDAACGQLVGKVIDRTTRSKRWKSIRLKVREEETWTEKLA